MHLSHLSVALHYVLLIRREHRTRHSALITFVGVCICVCTCTCASVCVASVRPCTRVFV